MKKLFLVSLCLLLSGCATVRTDFAPLKFDAAVSKRAGDILFTTGDLNRPYKEIGVIFVKGRHVGYQKIMETLREKAREVGADAVIKIEFGNRFVYYYRPYCRGVAVTFN